MVNNPNRSKLTPAGKGPKNVGGVLCLDSTPSSGEFGRRSIDEGKKQECESISGDSDWDSARDTDDSDSDAAGRSSVTRKPRKFRSTELSGKKRNARATARREREVSVTESRMIRHSEKGVAQESGGYNDENANIADFFSRESTGNSSTGQQKHHLPGSVMRAGGRSGIVASGTSMGGRLSRSRKNVPAFRDENGWIKRGGGGGGSSVSASSAFQGSQAAAAKNQERRLKQSKLSFSSPTSVCSRVEDGDGVGVGQYDDPSDGITYVDDGYCSEQSYEMLT